MLVLRKLRAVLPDRSGQDRISSGNAPVPNSGGEPFRQDGRRKLSLEHGQNQGADGSPECMRPSLLKLTQPEAEAIIKRSGLAIIPMGSVEQHGPHLPCGTDYLASLVIGQRAAEDVDGLLVPFCPVGVTPFHMSFAGTLTLQPQTFMALVEDVCGSLAHHGVKKIVFLNWHEGNTSSMNLAAVAAQQRYGVRVLVVQACYIALELFGKDCGLTHGGELEVLPVLAYDSSLVHLERATNSSPAEQAKKVDSLRRS